MSQDSLQHTTAPVAQPLKVASLRVGQQYYALDIMFIKEIIRPLPIVSVPQAPNFVDGVISLRKAAIPVIDLRRRFGFDALVEEQKKQRIVICAIDGRILGLLVDEVAEIISLSAADVSPTPYYLSGVEAEFFPGICRHGEHLLMLLDLRKLLAVETPLDMRERDSSVLLEEKLPD